MSRKIFIKASSVLLFLCLLPWLGKPLTVQADVSLDSRSYQDLQWLAALGYLPAFASGIKPLSRLEMASLTLEAERLLQIHMPDPIVYSTLSRLRQNFRQEIDFLQNLAPEQDFFKPLETLRLTCLRDLEHAKNNGTKNSYDRPENNYGRAETSGLLIDWSCRGRLWDRMGFYLRPFYSIDDHNHFEFTEAYLQYKLKYLSLEIGKEALWWGQGSHGTLQLTNNAKPFKLIHLSNKYPFVLPSFLRPLGLCRFSFFFTELEKDRPFGEENTPNPTIHQPKFSGLNISLKVNPNFEVGLIRTFVFKKWKDFIDVLLARHENDSGGPGNQQMGFNWRITFPNRFQPLTLYGEHAGEDEAGALPSDWAHLGGIYLPAIGGCPQFRFRIEYATTHASDQPEAWYTHAATNEGLAYSYQGRIMGHHMGPNAEDLYLSIEWESRSARLKIRPAFDYEQRWRWQEISEKRYQYLLSLEHYWSSTLLGTIEFQRELSKNQDHQSGKGENDTRLYLSLQLML